MRFKFTFDLTSLLIYTKIIQMLMNHDLVASSALLKNLICIRRWKIRKSIFDAFAVYENWDNQLRCQALLNDA